MRVVVSESWPNPSLITDTGTFLLLAMLAQAWRRLSQTQSVADGLQAPVDVVRGIDVLLAFFGIAGRIDDGQEIFGLGRGILVHYLLHALLPLDEEHLAGLATAV